jgi:hypothetical protein
VTELVTLDKPVLGDQLYEVRLEGVSDKVAVSELQIPVSFAITFGRELITI